MKIKINNKEWDLFGEKEYEEAEVAGEKANNIKRKESFQKVKGKIISITPILATAIFLLLGFQWGAWHPGWVVFVAIPIVSVILNLPFDNKKAIMYSLCVMLAVAAFLVLGFLFDAWHPGWLVFFIIPIAGILFE